MGKLSKLSRMRRGHSRHWGKLSLGSVSNQLEKNLITSKMTTQLSDRNDQSYAAMNGLIYTSLSALQTLVAAILVLEGEITLPSMIVRFP
ncbi:MAG: hypothetical protein CMQ45_03085 [Gammaproteobacteria bacterium]|nr:hypothetical protein [Gammaproteobacteria bacterium]